MINSENRIIQYPSAISKGFIDFSYPLPAQISLRTGSKNLNIEIYRCNQLGNQNLFASTRIENIFNASHNNGLTTLLYSRAGEILQNLANESDGSIYYKFTTKNQKMLNWALHPEKGVAIFNWENILVDASGNVHFIKEIKPE